MSLQVNITDIEKALLRLLKELREQKGELVEIDPVDFYWSINREELYDPYHNPSHLTLGQLTDDLEEIKRIAERKAEPVSQDFVKISSVLAAIGHKTVW
ncbi:MAG: hypothetical protein DHS20C18_08280 [Saprospiraceae bacterium]|nr:MAG: hypothetical protein DHS20C18_08280 [Saprospiraceae bacterium]